MKNGHYWKRPGRKEVEPSWKRVSTINYQKAVNVVGEEQKKKKGCNRTEKR